MISSNPFTEENFYAWLSSHVSSAKVSDLYKTFTEITAYCKKKGLVSTSIFQIQNVSDLNRIEQKILEDKFIWMTNPGLSKKVRVAFPYYVQFIKDMQEDTQSNEDVDEARIEELVSEILSEKEEKQNDAGSFETHALEHPNDFLEGEREKYQDTDGQNDPILQQTDRDEEISNINLLSDRETDDQPEKEHNSVDSNTKVFMTVPEERRKYLSWLKSQGIGEIEADTYIRNLRQYATWVNNHTEYEWNLLLIDDADILKEIYEKIQNDSSFLSSDPITIPLFKNALVKYFAYRGVIIAAEPEFAQSHNEEVGDEGHGLKGEELGEGRNDHFESHIGTKESLNIQKGSSFDSNTAEKLPKKVVSKKDSLLPVSGATAKEISGLSDEKKETQERDFTDQSSGSARNHEKGTYEIYYKANVDYSDSIPFSITYFGETKNVSSWPELYVVACQFLFDDYPTEFIELRDNYSEGQNKRLIYDQHASEHLANAEEIAPNYYVDGGSSPLEIIQNITVLLDNCRVDYENLVIKYKAAGKDDTVDNVSKEQTENISVESDPLIEYLEKNQIEYYDYRGKAGALWIIDGTDVYSKISPLRLAGVSFKFKKGGGNATKGRDAWWTKDKLESNATINDNISGANEKRDNKSATISHSPGATTTENYENERKAFATWLREKKTTESAIRTALWVCDRIDEFAVKYELTNNSIYTLKNPDDLQRIWEILNNITEFVSFKRRNSVYSPAFNFNQYCEFRMGERDKDNQKRESEDKSKEERLQIKKAPVSLRASQDMTLKTNKPVHPGKKEFEEWLKSTNCPAGTIKNYLDAIERMAGFAVDNKITRRNLYSIHSVSRLETIRSALLQNTTYKSKYNSGNTYLDFYALKKYILFRKDNTEGKTEDEGSKRFSYVLRERFENGFRINSIIDRNRFKQYYADAFDSELEKTDDELLQILQKVGSLQNDRIFYREGTGSVDLIDDIQEDIVNTLNQGASCIYYSELFLKYQQVLSESLQVFSQEAMKELLTATCYSEYSVGKLYAYKKAKKAAPDNDIRDLMRKSPVPLNYDQIRGYLWYIPLDVIKHSLVMNSELVNVAQETYFYAHNLPVSSEELAHISSLLHKQLEQKSFITDKEMNELIQAYCPSVAINTEGFTVWGLRNCLAVLLQNQFSFKGPIISEYGNTLNTDRVFRDFCRSHEVLTLEELKDFAKEVSNGIIYWDSVMDVMVRTSQSEFLPKNKVQFDVPETDAILDEMLEGDYQALKEFRLFLHFPTISIKWNEFVLESYVAGYSRKFKLLHASYTAYECCGAIVRRKSNINDLGEVLLDVLAHDDTWQSKDDALTLLVREGYLQRKNYSKIDRILVEARAKREKRQKDQLER